MNIENLLPSGKNVFFSRQKYSGRHHQPYRCIKLVSLPLCATVRSTFHCSLLGFHVIKYLLGVAGDAHIYPLDYLHVLT